MGVSADPPRLSASAPHGSVLHQGIAAARNRGPSEEQRRILERNVLMSVAPPQVPTMPTAAPTGWPSTVALKAGLGTLIVATLAILGAARWMDARPPAPDRQVPSSRARAVAIENAAPRPSVDLVRPPPATVVRDVSVQKRTGTRRRSGTLSASADDELKVLEKAQRSVAHAPAVALALTNEHQKRFPGGVLSEEREVIAVAALVNLGRERQAHQRAERFVAEHPGSAYLARIQAALASKLF